MRHNSPTIQLALVAIILLLTTATRRLLNDYLLQKAPFDVNQSYDRHLPTSIIACLSGFLGILLVNLLGVRYIFLFYSLTNVVYASAIIVSYRYGNPLFEGIALLIDVFGYDAGRVATLVVVLAYPKETWKARALAAFMMLEYLSATMGDIVAIQSHDDQSERFAGAIAYLCIACLAPALTLTIAPSESVVRDDGVYLTTPETNLSTEICQTAKLFANRYMLLLIPYMFSYPFLFGTAGVEFPNIETIVLYDAGKLFIVFMSQMLDAQWTGRRIRGFIGLGMLTVFFIASVSITAAIMLTKFDTSGVDASWSPAKISEYMMAEVLKERHALMLTSYFFAGTASSFIELFGYWIMGTLTNDLKSSARFVGTYHSAMAAGGLIGSQLEIHARRNSHTKDIPMYAAISLTFVSLFCMYFVVRRIPESNDWTLDNISNSSRSSDERKSDCVSEIVTMVADVKYQHVSRTTKE
ncbi:hypothetical protein LPJ53_004405 [Coemansia erecta]|uniref:MFS general substrate transporter n=1 Tax=Coemansia erecta TaxID=147472 RepID=A0A9W8CPU1_9FUNG|nr:hypothetical protein LPJ53_004405 [Coemansia erecta]